jgi:peptide/nickel transport system ATP-binding protein
MRQRVMIAMAVACDPKVLIADEPTTALDVTIQAGILDVLRGLRERLGTSIVLITHDLGVVADLADRVAVMYAGRVVETAEVHEIFAKPQHPYTVGLLGASPAAWRHAETHRLSEIPGLVPVLSAQPDACTFADRCSRADDSCTTSQPELTAGVHRVACWHPVREAVEV